jgi:hypothetical protein
MNILYLLCHCSSLAFLTLSHLQKCSFSSFYNIIISEVKKAGDIQVVQRGKTRNEYTMPTEKALEKQEFQGLGGSGITRCILFNECRLACGWNLLRIVSNCKIWWCYISWFYSQITVYSQEDLGDQR